MKKEKSLHAPTPSTSRRRFAKGMATAVVAAPLVSAVVGSAQNPPTNESKAPPNPQPTPTPAPAPPSPVAEAYAAVARARFGVQFTDEEFRRIRRDLEGNVRVAERLRAFKLQNSDEPDFVFAA